MITITNPTTARHVNKRGVRATNEISIKLPPDTMVTYTVPIVTDISRAPVTSTNTASPAFIKAQLSAAHSVPMPSSLLQVSRITSRHPHVPKQRTSIDRRSGNSSESAILKAASPNVFSPTRAASSAQSGTLPQPGTEAAFSATSAARNTKHLICYDSTS